jgi:hypothetical protein
VAPSPNALAAAELKDGNAWHCDLHACWPDALKLTAMLPLDDEAASHLVARCEHILAREARSGKGSPEGLIEPSDAWQARLDSGVPLQDSLGIVQSKVALKVAGVPQGYGILKRSYIAVCRHMPLTSPAILSATVRPTPRISCEAVPPSNSPAGAQGGTSARSTGAALSFVSCIRLLGRAMS